MAICEFCEAEMLEANGCIFSQLIFADGTIMWRSTAHFDEPSGRCHDCGAIHGKCHHFGCDVERCPRCGEQLITCNCELLEGQ